MRRANARIASGGRPGLPPNHVANTRLIRFPGLSGVVRLTRADPVIDGFSRICRGWRPLPATAKAGAAETLCAVEGTRGVYSIASPWLDAPLDGLPLASAVCGLVADLAESYAADHPDHLSLHCGAVRFGDRLVALTGPARAGKSTLMARLTAEADLTVFCDDVLPVDPAGNGISLGIAPRLRLPLPAAAAPGFRDHVDRSLALQDDRYGYVMADTVASHGTKARLGAVVLLSRREGQAARMQRLAPDEAIKTLLLQNMADGAGAEAELARVAELAADLVCLRLVYSDLEQAVALLRQIFLGDDWATHPAIGPVEAETAPPVMAEDHAPADLSRVWQRRHGVALRQIGGEGVLWSPDLGVFRLNPLAAAIWSALDLPERGQDIADALAAAFPDQDAGQVADDLARLLGRWQAEGLIETPRS